MEAKWTAEKVRIAAGLQPFETFKFKVEKDVRTRRQYFSEKFWLQEWNRQTGRTTKMICEAIAQATQKRKVCLIVHNEQCGVLIFNKTLELARQAGISSEYVEQYVEFKNIKGSYDCVLIDNAVTD